MSLRLSATWLTLLLAACSPPGNSQADAPQAQATTMAAAAVPAEDAPGPPKAIMDSNTGDPCDDARHPEFDIETCGDPDANIKPYAGTWRISGVEVATGKVQAFVKDDPAVLGAEFTISRAKIEWTKKEGAQFNTEDVCLLPSAAPITAIVQKEEGEGLKSAAAARKLSGTMHRFGCINGGSWGPANMSGGQSLFIPVGTNRMLMQWYDGAFLVADRVQTAKS